jgi:glycosyltransferase involved in cell wall biosynthesis
MGGVGARALELARVLARSCHVTLAGRAGTGSAPTLTAGSDIDIRTYRHERPDALQPLIKQSDVVVAQPQPPRVTRWLAHSGARLVFDLYDPEVFENLALFAETRSPLSPLWLAVTSDRLASALHVGHHFICASERQRDLWLGAIMAERLLPVGRYAADPSLRSVIDVVPFGVSADRPIARPGVGARTRFPTIGPDDRILLWNGGLWSWLDPELVIRAVARLSEGDDGPRLVFMGASSHVAVAATAERARTLARDLGLLDRVVFLNDEWVPYADRASWLLEAECAVTAQSDHLEARFAYRTRVLDCFWAGVPVVCSRGDELADRIERDDLGATAPPGDLDLFVAALKRVLARGRASYSSQLAAAARVQRWETVAVPLVEMVHGQRPTARVGRTRRALAARPSQRVRSITHQAARRALALRGRSG